jgi:preflagellin peptidase FlaK
MMEVGSLTLTIILLVYASWRDWKTREVSNRVWIVLGSVGGFLTGFKAFVWGRPELLFWSLGLAFLTVLALALYYVGFLGGADSKALICLGLALPVLPSFLNPILGLWIVFLPFTIIFNTFFLAALTVLYVALRNFIYWARRGSIFEGFEDEPLRRKIAAFLVAYKVNRGRLPGNLGLSLAEKPSFNHGRKWNFRFRISEEEKLPADLPEEVWVTPQLPLLFFITLALGMSLILGDLVLQIVVHFLMFFRV